MALTHFLLSLLICSLCCIGVFNVIHEFYFTFTKKELDRQEVSSKWYFKPLFGCITCFSSLWGCAFFIIVNSFRQEYIPFLILNSICLAFLNPTLYGIYKRWA